MRTSPVSASGVPDSFTFPAGGQFMGKTLLLADDSITIQKVVGIIFANEDFELVVVDNGNAALERARELKPDVMLIDAHMPGMTGYEVCSDVRRDPLLKDTPLLLLVGAFEHFDEERAKESGIDDHITKPFESQNLIDKVKALFELGTQRHSALPPPSEDIVPEVPLSAEEEPFSLEEVPLSLVEEPAPPASSAANLSDSFRSFVHLGGEPEPRADAEQAVPETISLGEPQETPVTTKAEQDGVILLSSVDIVEAVPEDDPWGTFSEEIVEGEAIEFGEIVEEHEKPSFEEPVEEIEPFTLLDEDENAPTLTEPVDTGWGAEIPGTAEKAVEEAVVETAEAPAYQPVVEPAVEDVASEQIVVEDIMLGEKPKLPATENIVPVEEPGQPLPVFSAPPPARSPIRLEPEPEADELQFAPEEEYIPAADIFTAQAAEPVEPTAPRGEAVFTVTEEQLAAAISRISREVIEKIAWDVVPDLAEMIIKEEIRRIKEGMSR
jgi:CheY-like chemotaxis protein